MRRIVRTLFVISIIIGIFFSYNFLKNRNLKYYTAVTMRDEMQIMVKEVAVVERFTNEFIKIIPEGNNVLLISVIEAYNTTGRDIDPEYYFGQKVTFKKEEYSAQMFSVYEGVIKNNKKRYLYFISELPYDVIKKNKIKGVDVAFDFGSETKIFSDTINNEYGFQDLITNTYEKIDNFSKEYDKYWADDMYGFKKIASERESEKNYRYLYKLIESMQYEYQSKIEVLEINLDQMQEISLITPIYPDANIKLIKETIFLKNNLEAIANIENTIDSQEGLELFIETAEKNLAKAVGKNKEAFKNLEINLKQEKMEL